MNPLSVASVSATSQRLRLGPVRPPTSSTVTAHDLTPRERKFAHRSPTRRPAAWHLLRLSAVPRAEQRLAPGGAPHELFRCNSTGAGRSSPHVRHRHQGVAAGARVSCAHAPRERPGGSLATIAPEDAPPARDPRALHSAPRHLPHRRAARCARAPIGGRSARLRDGLGQLVFSWRPAGRSVSGSGPASPSLQLAAERDSAAVSWGSRAIA